MVFYGNIHILNNEPATVNFPLILALTFFLITVS